MRSRSWLAVLAVGVVLGNACSPPPKQAAPAPPAAAVPPPAPAASPAPVSADRLAPLTRVEGDGIVLAELVDGRVRLQTTAVWGEALDTTYDSCDYFRSALPVLERQLSPERGKHLAEVCFVPPPPALEKPAKGGRRVKTVQPSTAKAKAKVQAAVPPASAPSAPANAP